MSVKELKTAVAQLLDNEENPEILEAVYAILNQSNKEAEIREEMYARALRSEEDIKSGRVFTLEEAKAKINAKLGK